MSNPYESDELLAQYLGFHFRGGEPDYLPHHPELAALGNYPERCAHLLLLHLPPEQRGHVLDLGCAVGRSSFELSAHCETVTGIDFSHRFVNAAKEIAGRGVFQYTETEEGARAVDRSVVLKSGWRATRIDFQQGDACNLPSELGGLDGVLLANLLCRLPDPQACLQQVVDRLNPSGILAITTPCSWDEAYTPRDNWLARDGGSTIEGIEACVGNHCQKLSSGPMAFAIRDHARKCQYTIAEASVWKKHA